MESTIDAHSIHKLAKANWKRIQCASRASTCSKLDANYAAIRFSKGYITLFLAFNDAFVALNFHYKAFSPPSALYLLASAHALNAIRFQSTFNPPPEVD